MLRRFLRQRRKPKPDINLVVGALAMQAGAAVPFDIREDQGEEPVILEKFRSLLDAGRAVGLWDSHDVMQPFAMAKLDDVIVVSDMVGNRFNFATLEAALKSMLQNCEKSR